MRKISVAFNEANLAVMGLYETVYDMYVNLQTIYHSAIEHLDKSSILLPDQADDMCRNQVRQILEGFLSSHTSFFSRDYDKLHINTYGLRDFSMLEVKHGARALQIMIRDITFHSFLEALLMIVVRIIAQRKNRQHPENEIDLVLVEVNEHIVSLAAQYRKRIAVTSTNKKVSEDDQCIIKCAYRCPSDSPGLCRGE